MCHVQYRTENPEKNTNFRRYIINRETTEKQIFDD